MDKPLSVYRYGTIFAMPRTCYIGVSLLVLTFGVRVWSAEPEPLRITVLSSRAELVSGGDALVRVETAAREDVQVRLNDLDVTSSFQLSKDGPGLVGLVTGLRNGENELVANVGSARGSLKLTNYPITGPILSGPHEQPFICETERFKLQSGEMLGPALDSTCMVKTRVDYYYRATGVDKLVPLIDPQAPPAETAQITTWNGETVPYVVRIETGTINRAVYQIAMLEKGWNEKLIYTFGGGCPGGWFRQGATTGGVDNDAML